MIKRLIIFIILISIVGFFIIALQDYVRRGSVGTPIRPWHKDSFCAKSAVKKFYQLSSVGNYEAIEDDLYAKPFYPGEEEKNFESIKEKIQYMNNTYGPIVSQRCHSIVKVYHPLNREGTLVTDFKTKRKNAYCKERFGIYPLSDKERSCKIYGYRELSCR